LQLRGLLVQDDLQATSEVEILHAIRRWTEPEEQKKHLSELLGFVRVTQLSPDEAFTEIFSVEDIKQDSACRSFFDAAMLNFIPGLQNAARHHRFNANPRQYSQAQGGVEKAEVLHPGAAEPSGTPSAASTAASSAPEASNPSAERPTTSDRGTPAGPSRQLSATAVRRTPTRLAALRGEGTPAIVLLGGKSINCPQDTIEVFDGTAQRWATMDDTLPEPLYDHGAAILGEDLAVFGGKEAQKKLRKMARKCNLRVSWTSFPALRKPKSQFAVAQSGSGEVFVCGGWDGKECMGTVDRFDPNTSSSWELFADIPTNCIGARAAVVDGKLLLTGGEHDSSRILNTVEEYRQSGHASSEVQLLMLCPRAYHGISVLNDEVYVTGGMTRLIPFRVCNSTGIYSPTTGQWRRGANMNEGRYRHAQVTFQGRIWVIGGMGPAREALHSCEVYSPATQRWERSASLNMPRWSAAVVVIG
jgi:N-acetylneuraminic acid mutarotase